MNAGRRRETMHLSLPPEFLEKFGIEEKGYIPNDSTKIKSV
jgi:hypothetical protein